MRITKRLRKSSGVDEQTIKKVARGIVSVSQVFAGLIGWLSIWLSVTLPVVVGHSYGAAVYFFKIWGGDWPCFRGEQVRPARVFLRTIIQRPSDALFPDHQRGCLRCKWFNTEPRDS